MFSIKTYHWRDFFDTELLTSIQEEYHKSGIVKVAGLFSDKELDKPVQDLLSVLNLNIEIDGIDNSADEMMKHFISKNAKSAEIALRIAKDLPSFQNLISSNRLVDVISALLGEQDLLCPFDWTLFRIDGPATKVSHFDWHQDYPYNVLSEQAVTFWIPLLDVDEDMGGIRFVPSSHKKIYPVQTDSTPKPNNPNRLVLKKSKELDELLEKQVTSGKVKKGECLLFNTLLMHASGINKSDNYRWIANGRYAPANDHSLMKREYYMARVKYPNYFETAHPELVS